MTEAETKCRELVKGAGVDPDKAVRLPMFRYYVGLYMIGITTADALQMVLRQFAKLHPSIQLHA